MLWTSIRLLQSWPSATRQQLRLLAGVDLKRRNYGYNAIFIYYLGKNKAYP